MVKPRSGSGSETIYKYKYILYYIYRALYILKIKNLNLNIFHRRSISKGDTSTHVHAQGTDLGGG